MKTCAKCGEEKPLESFSLYRSGNPRSECHPCYRKRWARWKNENLDHCRAVARENARKRRAKDPDRDRAALRKSRLKTNYGLTREAFLAMGEAQGWTCAICFSPVIERHKDMAERLYACVDHDHETGKVRGILCNLCNRGLGLLGDSLERLRSAAAYLEERA